jgi:hypothetical protein
MGESATIPCEFCDQPVESNDYVRHIGVCEHARGAIAIPISFYVNGRDDELEYESPSDSDCDEDFEELQRYITSNRQITTGNLRTFLEEHFTSSSITRGSSPSSAQSQNVLMLRVPLNRHEGVRLTSYDLYSALPVEEIGVSDIDNVSCLIDYDKIKDDTCPICQQTFKDCWEENVVGMLFRELKCKHAYCDDCITIWLKKHKNCPVCKHVLE